MSMELETFEQQSQGTGDKLGAKDIMNTPLLVKVREERESVRTKHKPEGTPAIVLDVLNLMTQEIKLGIMWFNPAVVDNLRPHIGKAMAIQLVTQQPKGTGNAYLIPEQLEGANLDAAKAWASQRPNLFEDEYERRGLELPKGAVGTLSKSTADAAAPAASAPTATTPTAAMPGASTPAEAPVATPPPAATPPVASSPVPDTGAAPSATTPAAPPAAPSGPPAPGPAASPAPPAPGAAASPADDEEPPF